MNKKTETAEPVKTGRKTVSELFQGKGGAPEVKEEARQREEEAEAEGQPGVKYVGRHAAKDLLVKYGAKARWHDINLPRPTLEAARKDVETWQGNTDKEDQARFEVRIVRIREEVVDVLDPEKPKVKSFTRPTNPDGTPINS